MSRFFSMSGGAGALIAVIVMGVSGQADAGLVTGRWDPGFGSFRPGLNWQIQGQFLVPNGCSAQADGIYLTSSGACAGSVTQSLDLRLFNGAADPNNFYASDANSQYRTLHADAFGTNGGYVISQVRIAAGQVVGFVAGFTGNPSSPIFESYSNPPEAMGNAYGAWLDILAPGVICYICDGGSSVVGENTGLSQFLVTYTSDNDSQAKFTDSNGVALGARLDANGNYIDQGTSPLVDGTVPEPGALALVLLGLGVAGAAGRRRG